MSVARNVSEALRPTPVALSNTRRRGTPPRCSNTFFRPWETRSAFWPGNSCARPTFEYGNETTMKCCRRRTPMT